MTGTTDGLLGHVDGPVEGETVFRPEVIVRGWHLWDGAPALAVAVEAEGVRRVVTIGSERPDVAEDLGDPELSPCGWRVVLDLSDPPAGRSEYADIAVTIWTAPESEPVALAPVRVHLSDVALPDGGPPVSGRLDCPSEGQIVTSPLMVSGWALGDNGPVSRVEVVVDGRRLGPARLGMPRMDMRDDLEHPHAVISGFEHLVDLSDQPPGSARVEVHAWADGEGPFVVVDHWFELATEGRLETGADPGPAWPGRRAVLVDRRQRLIRQSAGPTGTGLNLAVIVNDLQVGGAQLWLTELLRLWRAGVSFPCRVLSFGGGPLVGDLEAAGIEVHVTQNRIPPDIESYEGRLTEVTMWLAAGGHNAALVNTVVPWLGARAAMEMGLPVVWAIHESVRPEDLWASLFASQTVAPDVRATLLSALRRSQALVFVTETTRQMYLHAGGADRSVVVPYGINQGDIDSFNRRVSKNSARESVGLDPGARVLLALGVVQPRKAQTALAAAFAEVADDHPEAVLVIVGDRGDVYGTALVEYLERRALGDRVRVVPVARDPYVWYRAADAFVCASDIESMPRTIMEALSFGVPVVATAVFGVPDLVREGETGYLFEARDITAAADALRRLLETDQAELDRIAASGRRLAVETLDSAGYARDLMTLIDGLRSDPTARPADLLGRIVAATGR